jgi:F420H(2)-dependent quinone reductase
MSSPPRAAQRSIRPGITISPLIPTRDGSPDQVWVQVGGTKRQVTVEQLSGDERSEVWEQVVARAPNFGAYPQKTDREIPVLRLTPVS